MKMAKQEVLNYLDNVLHPIVSPDNWNVYSELHDMIEELPSAEPVRHGEWISQTLISTSNGTYMMHQCSECGDMTINRYKYCPNCGARMDRNE